MKGMIRMVCCIVAIGFGIGGQAPICMAQESTETSSAVMEEEILEVDEEAEQAEMLDTLEEQVIGELDTSEIDNIMGDIFVDSKVRFTDLLAVVLSGEYEEVNEVAYQYLVEQFFYELSYSKTAMVHILMLTILASIFTNFSNAFGNEQIASMGFYILYLLLLIVTLQSFQVIMEEVILNMELVLAFMSALCPVYFLAVAIASGNNSAIVFYNLTLLYIYLVELLVLSVVLPLVNTYIVVEVLNYLTAEKRLSKLSKLVKMLIDWILKILLAGVVGLNVIQGLISPMIDNVQRTIWLKGAEAIPVVGDVMSGTGEVVIGTLKLIKNGIGVVGLILCIAITSGPVIQLGILTLMYKFVAAVVEPVSDKRISSCLYSVGEGCQFLLKAMISVSILFLVTIAVVATTTS